uniref:Uncharacterized protein n=1 Tax=Leersia perrieri TaxID=77586 RepID=A0A0D9WW53_9ORYZ
MAATTMALTSSFAAAAAAGAPWRVRVAVPAGVAPRRRSNALVVRAQSEQDMEPPKATEETPASTSSSSPSPANPPPAAATKKPPPSLFDALAFSGPAPERINGRLAMVGFVSALAVEAGRGGGILEQAGSGSGAAWFAATAAVLTAASLVPLLRGETAEARGGAGALMSADAEIWNGRFAMLGLVALAFTEFLTGSPLVNV